MRLIRTIVIGVVLAAVVVGGYWYFRIRPRVRSIAGEFDQPKAVSEKDAIIRQDSSPEFDLIVDLPGDPIGIVAGPKEFLIGNRADPWGFLRLQRDEDEFEIRKHPVIETSYGQKMSFDSITYNGKEYVGVAMQSWFERGEGKVFTVHDPETLAIKSYSPAPNLIGCIAWDGASYWAATRKNTEDSTEPVYLYRFDREFRETGRYDAPGVGCQGMAWDGTYLWLVDVFSDSIHILDVGVDPPKLIHSHETRLTYLSGIAYDGKEIWVTEYGEMQLHRLRPTLRAQFSGAASPESASTAASTTADSTATATDELKTSAAYTNSSPERGPEDMEVLELKLETIHDKLYASWRIHFGDELFSSNTPSPGAAEIAMPRFVRYTVTIRGESLVSSVETEHEATPGENVENDRMIASGLAPGVYSVGIFLHAQYVKADGTNQILNKSSSSLEVAVR